MYTTVPPVLWMQLDAKTKAYFVEKFGIKRTGTAEIRDQELISDGYSIDDLRAISHEKMTEYIGSEESFPRAWELTCAKAKFEFNPPVELKGEPQPLVTPEPIVEMAKEIIETKTETNDSKNKKSK